MREEGGPAMRSALSLLMVLGLACGVCSAEQASPSGKAKVEERRAQTQVLYNDAFNRNILMDPREAEAEFEKLQRRMERVNPDDPGDPAVGKILFQRGYLVLEAGKYRKAIRLFEELARRFPGHSYADDALYQIGYVYQRHLKDYDKAAEAYSRLAREYRDRESANPALWQNAQMAVQQRQVDQATVFLNDAADNARAQRMRRGQKAVPSFYEQQSGQMLRFIEFNKEPAAGSEPLALYLQGANGLQEGRLKDAQKSFAAILKDYSKSRLADDAAFGLAEVHRLSGRLDEAVKAYQNFIKKHADSELALRARFQLAEFERLSGNEKEARRLYEAVVAAPARKGEPPELRRARTLAKRRLQELGAPRRGGSR